jgi:K(+)-stimulated pyrophosphate-energized sodium pump
MNILIKLMSIVSLVIAPHIARVGGAPGIAPTAARELMELQPPVRFVQQVATPVVQAVLHSVWRQL